MAVAEAVRLRFGEPNKSPQSYEFVKRRGVFDRGGSAYVDDLFQEPEDALLI